MAIATLSIDIVAKLANIERDMNRVAKVATDGFSSIKSAALSLVPAIAAVTSASAGFEKLLTTQRQFDVLSAGLETATGSAKNAGEAFDALQAFAAKTPYDLAQTTDAFTKLVNLGLTPSEKALTSYGNTASAMGKDLNQMIEAVADAATGEFERLKEFGIKASSQGDQVAFTFRGITTTVANNAAAIEGYLMGIGEKDFAGAMDKRMASLDGLISNLGDSWDRLFLNVSKQGVGEAISDGVKVAIDVLDELNASFASGEAVALIDAYTARWSGFKDDIESASIIVGEFFGQFEGEGKGAMAFLAGAFTEFPQNVRAAVQIATVEVASTFDKISAYATAFKDGIKAVLTDDTVDEVGQRLEASLNGINEARSASLEGIMAERQASVDSANVQIAKAHELRATYDADHKAQVISTDALGKYKIKATGQLNQQQAKLMEEYRLAEEKATLSAADFEIKQAQREAAAKLQIAGDNSDLKRKIEEELAAKIQAINSRRVSQEQQTADAVVGIWEQAAAKRVDFSGTIFNTDSVSDQWFRGEIDIFGNKSGSLPGFANGGNHLGGWRVVGERGPELEYTGPSQIVNAQDTQKILNGMGSGGISIGNITLPGITNARQFLAELQQLARTDPQALAFLGGRVG